MKKQYITASIFLCLALIISTISGKVFLELSKPSDIRAGDGVTKIKMLSDYFDGLKGTNGDTEIYVIEGEKPGGSILVLGGTHANEPSGHMAAITLIETAKMEAGTLYVIPRANNSAFTHNDPQEASPLYFHIETVSGIREFRFGSRATNPIDQWPDPDIYIHDASGQSLSGSETRNLNRGYPGRSDGTLTEQVCNAIVNMINEEKIDITVDLHEASPEYPVINATVAHEKSMDFASVGVMNLQLLGINMALEPSPTNLRGLTHRELGDYTDTYPILMETANPSQGRLRGKTDEEMVLTGKDKMYVKSADLGLLFVPFDENGHSLESRVGRHLQGIIEYSTAFSDINPEKTIKMVNVPTYSELTQDGISLGDFLK